MKKNFILAVLAALTLTFTGCDTLNDYIEEHLPEDNSTEVVRHNPPATVENTQPTQPTQPVVEDDTPVEDTPVDSNSISLTNSDGTVITSSTNDRFAYLAAFWSYPESNTGQLESVADGDTVTISGIRLRLEGIDTPEKYQSSKLDADVAYCDTTKELMIAMGEEATHFARSYLRIDRKYRFAISRTQNTHGRNVGRIYPAGITSDVARRDSDGNYRVSLNLLLVEKGYAVPMIFDETQNEDPLWSAKLQAAATSAEDNGLGLWAEYGELMSCLQSKAQ